VKVTENQKMSGTKGAPIDLLCDTWLYQVTAISISDLTRYLVFRGDDTEGKLGGPSGQDPTIKVEEAGAPLYSPH
jgi:hypothetical protein